MRVGLFWKGCVVGLIGFDERVGWVFVVYIFEKGFVGKEGVLCLLLSIFLVWRILMLI